MDAGHEYHSADQLGLRDAGRRLVGTWIPNPQQFGLGFALPAMFAGLVVQSLIHRKKFRTDLIVAGSTIVYFVLAFLWLPGACRGDRGGSGCGDYRDGGGKMTLSEGFIWLLIGVSLVTLLPRVLPMVLITKFGMPEWLLRFLQYVPIAVMTALLVQAVLTEGESFIPLMENVNLLALIPTLIVAIATRSLLFTVITGIGAMFLLQLFGL